MTDETEQMYWCPDQCGQLIAESAVKELWNGTVPPGYLKQEDADFPPTPGIEHEGTYPPAPEVRQSLEGSPVAEEPVGD